MRPTAVLLAVLLASAIGRAGPTVRIEAVKDNSIVLYRGEERLNAGGERRIRIKGNQHLVALGFDLSPIRGRLVRKATLVCRPAARRIEGVTVSTIQAAWEEHASNALTSGMPGRRGWAWPGARFPDVCGGNSFSLVCQARSDPSEELYRFEIDPDLVHALAVGAAYGLAVHEWGVDYSRNPTIWSREEPGKGPHLLLEMGGEEPSPGVPRDLTLFDSGDPESLKLRLRAPDHGFAYTMKVNGKVLPRWNIPFVRPGEVKTIPIRDLALRPGAGVKIDVAVLDRRGGRSRTVSVRGRVPRPAPTPDPSVPRLSRAGAVDGIRVLPLADKLDETGAAVGKLPRDHLLKNAVSDGKTIRLAAAKGEVVGFMALLRGKGEVAVTVRLGGLRTEILRGVFVEAGGRRIPDPLVPAGRLSLHPDRPTTVCVDVFVPFDEKRDRIAGEFRLSDGRKLPIELRVRGFGLPRRASFLCEMNSYGVPDTVKEYDRLQEIANDHRVHVNILHYSHRTAAPGARKCNLDMRMASGRRMDEKRYNAIRPGDRKGYWDDFAEVFGPFLTGRRFARSHRGPVPAPGFYLTFHESWPLNVRAHFNGNPDAYEAFGESPAYARTFTAVLRDFAARARREGWREAGFQVYLNNKGSLGDLEKNPWVLDEPAGYFDYRALAYYADLVHEAIGDRPAVPIRFRVDISRPQFDRGQLWGKAQLWVVGTPAFRDYPRLLADRRERSGETMWIYGSSNDIEASNRETMNWVLEAYRGGARGVVPWQTIDRSGRSLTKGDPLALFVFAGREDGKPVIHHSLRLKAYRRAQQDVEYLEILRERLGLSRGRMREFIDRYVDIGVPVSEETPEGHRRLREAAALLIESAR